MPFVSTPMPFNNLPIMPPGPPTVIPATSVEVPSMDGGEKNTTIAGMHAYSKNGSPAASQHLVAPVDFAKVRSAVSSLIESAKVKAQKKAEAENADQNGKQNSSAVAHHGTERSSGKTDLSTSASSSHNVRNSNGSAASSSVNTTVTIPSGSESVDTVGSQSSTRGRSSASSIMPGALKRSVSVASDNPQWERVGDMKNDYKKR